MHYNRLFLLGTAMTDALKGRGNNPIEKWWFKMAVARDENPIERDEFWVSGMISNMDNLANFRIRDYVRKGSLVMVEGILRSVEDKEGKKQTIILAKLIRAERRSLALNTGPKSHTQRVREG